jgi:glycosyltransferase involved in cell wall biosynthesis
MQKPDLKLVFVIDSHFPYYSGGRETWLYEHSKRLSKEYNITILAMKPPQVNKKPFYSISGLHNLKLYNIPYLGNVPIVRAVLPTLTYLSYFISVTVFLFPLLLKREKIIFISLNPGFCYLPLIFMRSKNFRRVCTVHGDFAEEMKKEIPFLPKRFLKFLETFSFKDANLTLLVAFQIHNRYNKIKPLCRKIEILSNSVDCERFKESVSPSDSDIKKLVCISTLRDIKGIPIIIKSIPYLIKKYKDPFVILFVGKGDPTQYIELAKKLGVEKYVKFLGERTDIPEILASSYASVGPFFGGIVALESMAAGKPIIAWDEATYKQILKHGYSGYLVPTWDAKALGEGIAHVLKNDDFAAILGRNAQREAQKYDINKILDRLFNYLRSLY